ncbi:hypothetical protein D3C77_778540 [compost metagenome]
MLIHESQGSKLDPSTRDGVGSKMGFDATVPLSAPPMRFKRIHVPGEREVELDKVASAAPDDWQRALEARH